MANKEEFPKEQGDIFWAEDANKLYELATNPVIPEVVIPDPTKLELDLTLPTNLSSTGIYSKYTVGQSMLTTATLGYVSSDGKVLKAQANDESTAKGEIVLNCAGISSDQEGTFLEYGYFRKDTWNWTVGAPVYIDAATASNLTQTAPSEEGNIVRIIGYAVTAKILFFNPDSTYIEV